ncbi:hypothetical protein [Streptomyces sp. MZ04]|uniref:hypothetical protein n=1 Tax=Streptomyces sp. MZ04 TaxID=2559236 RepID=UPI00107E816C|nr:hypothetical protein [Streptomyces sp. MZ04]TGB14414.1 hypothetical protein E2651_06200 [Streptomyces sp. MZ04]
MKGKEIKFNLPTVGTVSTLAVGSLIATDTVQSGPQITGLVVVAVAALGHDAFVAYLDRKRPGGDQRGPVDPPSLTAL